MAQEASLSPRVVITGDGSPTYLHPEHGASFRSLKGAVTESRTVFLAGSRLAHRQGTWRVLELGFGSGLNFQVTTQAAREAGVALEYVALEPYPMTPDLWLVDDCWRECAWGRPERQGQVTLVLQRASWQDFEPPAGHFDALYHDPFGPAVAPECWTADCFRWAARALARHGVLATYGASSAARRAMRQAQLQVGILPGAPGKREMTVASHRAELIAHARPWKRCHQPGDSRGDVF